YYHHFAYLSVGHFLSVFVPQLYIVEGGGDAHRAFRAFHALEISHEKSCLGLTVALAESETGNLTEFSENLGGKGFARRRGVLKGWHGGHSLAHKIAVHCGRGAERGDAVSVDYICQL